MLSSYEVILLWLWMGSLFVWLGVCLYLTIYTQDDTDDGKEVTYYCLRCYELFETNPGADAHAESPGCRARDIVELDDRERDPRVTERSAYTVT